jgi:signal transduction histidine kinase/CheY-like chemotaxis protein
MAMGYLAWLKRLILLVLCACGGPVAATVLDVAALPSQPLVGQYLDYLVDPQGDLSAAQVALLPAERWQASPSASPNFGFTTQVYWFRLQLANSATTALQKLLSIDYPVLDQVQLFIASEHGIEPLASLGDSLPAASRELPNPWLLQSLWLPAQSQKNLYFRVQTNGAVQFPLGLWQPQGFIVAQQGFLLGQGMYFGAVLIMVLYNLFIFILVRDFSYLVFVLSMCCYGLLQGTVQGFTPLYLWPNLPAMGVLTPLLIALYSATVAWFAVLFLRLPKEQPGYARWLTGYALLMAGLALASLWLPYNLSVRLSTLLTLPGLLLVIYVGLRMLFKGQRAARYFVLAWLTFLCASAVLALNKIGLLPNNFASEFAPQVSHVLICVLLSFALSDRINAERRARFLAQKQLLRTEREASHEHERLHGLQLHAQREELAARQAAIEATAESRAKSEFLSTMSHEIRTPMNGVLGMTELLRDSELAPQQRQYLEVIERSGRALLSIINDILDYSKIEAGKLNIEALDFDLDELCLECASMFTNLAETKQLELLCSVAPGTPTLINGDPTRLRQILLNLLGNAFKFTDSGFVHLRVSLQAPEGIAQAKHNLLFEVCDSGIGISPEGQAKLFKAFSQAEQGTTRKYGGSGLGLSICARLAELMGGQIGVHSVAGAGACFWFSIGCRDADASFVSSQVLPFWNLKGCRVLLVDDSPEYLQMLHEQVQHWGMQVQSVPAGAQALALLRSAAARGEGFQIACLDYSMPGMNGLQLAAAIKADPALASVRCLLLSAARDTPGRAELEAAGITLALQKPASAVVLKGAFRQLLSGLNEPPRAVHGPLLAVPEGFCVLVAEDNPVNQMVIRGLLGKLGVACELVGNGREAVNRLLAAPGQFSLVLMDCEMPEMDGYQATQAIRELERCQPGPAVRVLALTAHALQEHVERCIAAGMNGHLAKPLSLDSLREALQQHLQALSGAEDAARGAV